MIKETRHEHISDSLVDRVLEAQLEGNRRVIEVANEGLSQEPSEDVRAFLNLYLGATLFEESQFYDAIKHLRRALYFDDRDNRFDDLLLFVGYRAFAFSILQDARAFLSTAKLLPYCFAYSYMVKAAEIANRLESKITGPDPRPIVEIGPAKVLPSLQFCVSKCREEGSPCAAGFLSSELIVKSANSFPSMASAVLASLKEALDRYSIKLDDCFGHRELRTIVATVAIAFSDSREYWASFNLSNEDLPRGEPTSPASSSERASDGCLVLFFFAATLTAAGLVLACF